MQKLIKENIIFIALVLAALVAGLYFDINLANETMENQKQVSEQNDKLNDSKSKLEQLLSSKRNRENQLEKTASSGKVIAEVSGQQFSPEASFGIMFENLLSNITNTGVRIRSIDYNYQPDQDKILLTNIAGYNACELSFVTVSSYTQLQNLFKNIAKEQYLTSINEVYIEPYDKDKTILIAKFKVRLYTKTT